ncbi:hypothetical protein WDU94_015250 [Cyamophila willieti]
MNSSKSTSFPGYQAWISVDSHTDAGSNTTCGDVMTGMYMVTLRNPGSVKEEGDGGADVIDLPLIENVPVTCALKDPMRNMLYIGFSNGILRVIQLGFNDASAFLHLTAHDRHYGRINKLCFSPDQTRIYTCGDDGNIFSFLINDPNHGPKPPPLKAC